MMRRGVMVRVEGFMIEGKVVGDSGRDRTSPIWRDHQKGKSGFSKGG